MTTKLVKIIRRSVPVHGSRTLVVTIDPEAKRIGISEKGCRTIYWLPILTVFALAIHSAECLIKKVKV